ncbi:MAG: hypothetical protein A2Z96_02540 [Spirochaetes bacterium GWB1_48_6]|nr:MAG: hypothetical protein A2Z96_02540 [Spirochaetes bacterium GWB1_48_6]
MIRFITAFILGFILSFGYATFFHYQLVMSQAPEFPGTWFVALFTTLFTLGNFFLSFWNLAGFPKRPVSWKYFEEKGIPYNLSRDNLNILLFILISFGFFAVLSLGLDTLLNHPLGSTIKGIFFNEGAQKLLEFTYYWDRKFWYLFLPLYFSSLVSLGMIAYQAYERQGEYEIKEPEREIPEEDH